MQVIGRGRIEPTQMFGMLNLPWQVFKKMFTIIEAYVGMVKRLVRDFVIEEALQDEIK